MRRIDERPPSDPFMRRVHEIRTWGPDQMVLLPNGAMRRSGVLLGVIININFCARVTSASEVCCRGGNCYDGNGASPKCWAKL